RRAARRLSWRRSAARLEGAADDLDRPASRGRAHPVGARIRENVACPLAPPVSPATTRRLLAIRITRRRSIEPTEEAQHFRPVFSKGSDYGPTTATPVQPARARPSNGRIGNTSVCQIPLGPPPKLHELTSR